MPDNQECFADAEHDRSLIVEIVEHLAEVADADAAQYFLQDLADANGASGLRVVRAQQARAPRCSRSTVAPPLRSAALRRPSRPMRCLTPPCLCPCSASAQALLASLLPAMCSA